MLALYELRHPLLLLVPKLLPAGEISPPLLVAELLVFLIHSGLVELVDLVAGEVMVVP